MLRIEIFPEDVRVDVRTTRPKDNKPIREFYEQAAYAYLGGKFPVQMKVSLEKDQQPYPAGIYSPDSSSYTINSFGSLELKKFGMTITPLEVEK